MTQTTKTPAKKTATKKEAAPKKTIIDKKMYRGSQSQHYSEIYKYEGRKFKIEIKRDSYDMQSSARGYILTNEEGKEKWEFIYGIPYAEMTTCKRIGNHFNDIQEFNFSTDALDIQLKMNAIIF